MKVLISMTMVFAAMGMCHAAGTWTSSPIGKSGPLMDVKCVQSVCYIAGDSGVVLRTTDEGASWTRRSLPARPANASIAFSDSLHGYYAAGGNRSYRTTNGGVSWDSIATVYPWRQIHLIGKDQGYFTAVRTVQVGWTAGMHPYPVYSERAVVGTLEQNLDVNPRYVSGVYSCVLYFTGAPTGFAGCTGGNISRTVDGGGTWSETQVSSAVLNSLHFPASRIGYAVGDGGRIFGTRDSGVTWSAQASGTARNLRAVRFVDGETGYAVGDSGTILATSNGGLTWTAMASPTSSQLNAIAFLGDGSAGFAAGEKGVLLKLSGGTPAVPSSLSFPVRQERERGAGMKLKLPDGRTFNLLGRRAL